MKSTIFRPVPAPPQWQLASGCNAIFSITLSITLLLFTLSHFVQICLSQGLPDLSSGLGNFNDANDGIEPCEACRVLVRSFMKGLDATARGKHEGGDTSWEERNLKSYANSEVRLVEIQEQLCEDATKGKAQCLSLAEDAEAEIEDWWLTQKDKNVRLHDYLCINKRKVCCPDDTFGSNCQPCLSSATKCHNHGACDGSGTRQGTGRCKCDYGYRGETCDTCEEEHFRIAKSDNQFACMKCDSACHSCHGPGNTNCTQCRSGYHLDDRGGCVDINECDMGVSSSGDTRLCKGNTYCVNTDGHYKCAKCHHACAGCLGYGANRCLSCGHGYEMDEDHYCRSEDERDGLSEEPSDFAPGRTQTYDIHSIGHTIWIAVLVYHYFYNGLPLRMALLFGCVAGIFYSLLMLAFTDYMSIMNWSSSM